MAARPTEFLAWATETFGPIARDPQERVVRFLEEAIELAHAERVPIEMVMGILARVYARPRGSTNQEVGQCAVTLELFAETVGLSAEDEAAREFARVQAIPAETWRARHAAKVAIGIARGN